MLITENERKAYKALCHAILISAIRDAKVLSEHAGIRRFIESDWCEAMCMMGGIDTSAYRKEVARRMAIAVERSSPRRLQTYKLVEVLQDGKTQGQH